MIKKKKIKTSDKKYWRTHKAQLGVQEAGKSYECMLKSGKELINAHAKNAGTLQCSCSTSKGMHGKNLANLQNSAKHILCTQVNTKGNVG